MSPFDGPVTIIPRSMISWLFHQPDPETLNIKASILEAMKADYTIKPDPVRERIHVHEELIKRDLTRNLESVAADIAEELEASLKDILGTDTQNWKEVSVYEDMRKVLTRATNRVFVGLSLCRDDEFLKVANTITDLLGSTGNVIRKFPTIFHPAVAFFSTIPLRYHSYKCTKIMRPEIERRKIALVRTSAEPNYSYEPPNDFLTWSIQSAIASQPSIESQPHVLAARLAIVNFAANHSSTITATQAIFDIFSFDSAQSYVDLLRKEAIRALADEGGKWTKAAVGKLLCIDSAIRESQRMSSFDMHVGGRIVAAPDGIQLPNGTVLPRGSKIATPSHSIHFEASIYPNPKEYDPLRFSRPSTDKTSRNESANDSSKGKPLSMVNTSPEFLTFGHGRHACPGRFFAATVLKLLLALLVLDYEVKPFETRPLNLEVGETLLPDPKVKMLVKRREVAA